MTLINLWIVKDSCSLMITASALSTKYYYFFGQSTANHCKAHRKLRVSYHCLKSKYTIRLPSSYFKFVFALNFWQKIHNTCLFATKGQFPWPLNRLLLNHLKYLGVEFKYVWKKQHWEKYTPWTRVNLNLNRTDPLYQPLWWVVSYQLGFNFDGGSRL